MLNLVFEDTIELTNLIDCPDINDSGLRRFTTCSSVSTLIRWRENGKYFSNFPLDQIVVHSFEHLFLYPDLRYIIPVGVGHHPQDWCGLDDHGNGKSRRNADRENIFHYLNDRYLQDLKAGRAFLLLDQSHEIGRAHV